VWNVVDTFVGWHQTSKLPGAAGNVVLNGHHNIKGEVFRYLVDVEEGDRVILYAQDNIHYYQVTEKHILKEKGEPIEVRQQNARWIGPTQDERLTLITCWPYTNNTHRLIVVAKPVPDPGVEGLERSQEP
jgi:sortase A